MQHTAMVRRFLGATYCTDKEIAVLMDLSKAFDTIKHDLLIAKLYAHGIRGNSLKLLKKYLSNRLQRTKIEGEFSTWEELLTGLPQGSVLGPLLFNIYPKTYNELDIQLRQLSH